MKPSRTFPLWPRSLYGQILLVAGSALLLAQCVNAAMLLSGARARAVMDELHGEKIDIVDWSEDPAEFVAAALAPAKVSKVEITDLATRSAKVIVPDYQLSLAIGKDGQNARLAARLTGWRIDIHPDTVESAPADSSL